MLLLKLYRRQKSQRSKYVHVEAFKSVGGKSAFMSLYRKGLVFFYKNGNVVGLEKDGALYVINLLQQQKDSESKGKSQ